MRNGKPFFIAKYLIEKRDRINRPGNAICFCAWHAAMFEYGTHRKEDNLEEKILAYRTESEGGTTEPSILLTLCDEAVEIQYAEKHFIELQEILKALKKEHLKQSMK